MSNNKSATTVTPVFEELNKRILAGWGDTPQTEIPANFLEVQPPGDQSLYIPEFIKMEGPRRKVRSGRKAGLPTAERNGRLASKEAWMRERLGR